MTVIDITTACDGANDVWQTAVRVAKTVGADEITNVVIHPSMRAPAGSPIIKATDKTGRILVDGTGNGSFYSTTDVLQLMKDKPGADPGAAIREAMASCFGGGGFGGFGDAGTESPKAGNGGALSKNSCYTVSIATNNGIDVWQAAVQAGTLRTRVQEAAGLCAQPDVMMKCSAPVAELFAADIKAGGLGAPVYSAASVAELEAQVASAA